MYCKRCHKKIEKKNINCPYCGFNNNNDLEMGVTTEIDLSEIRNIKQTNKHKDNKIIVAIGAILIIIATLVIAYLFNGNQNNNKIDYTTTTTKEVVNTKEYKIDNLVFYYTLEFELENNKLYLIDNHDINIIFNKVDDDEYFNVLNNNEILDTTLNTIDAKTYANDNNYGYLLDIEGKKYHIEINYTDDITEETQASMNKVLKSIIIK